MTIERRRLTSGGRSHIVVTIRGHDARYHIHRWRNDRMTNAARGGDFGHARSEYCHLLRLAAAGLRAKGRELGADVCRRPRARLLQNLR
jgi:hypothetical protein